MNRAPRFKLVQDLAALTGGQLLSNVIGFLAFAYLARTLDPQSYGIVEYAVALSVVFAMVIDWGLGPIGVREVSNAPKRVASLAALIPTARLGLAVVAIPVMGLSATLLGHDTVTVQLVWLFALALLASPFKQDWLLQGMEMMTAVAAAQAIRMTVFAVGVIVVVHGPRDVVQVGVVELAAAAIVAAYYLTIQRLRVAPVRFKLAFAELRHLLKEGLAVGLTNMLWAILQYAPLILIGSIVGGAETAWFGASHRIVVALLALSRMYHFNLYPAIARRAGQEAVELRRLVTASFRVTAWAGILAALVLTLLARPLLVLAFGKQFAVAAPTFAILVWMLPTELLSGHARWTLIATGQQRYVLRAHVAGLAASLLVGAALIPALQSVGAAIALLAASFAVWGVAHAYAVARLGHVVRLWVAVPPGAMAVLMGLVAPRLATDPLVVTAIAATGYTLCALLVDRRLLADLRYLADAKSDPRP